VSSRAGVSADRRPVHDEPARGCARLPHAQRAQGDPGALRDVPAAHRQARATGRAAPRPAGHRGVAARAGRARAVVTRALAIIALVLLPPLPFLRQAIQGDDVYYLAGAEHAQIDPLHPHDTSYLFQGNLVDMRGFPHPPLNAWVLAAL